MEKKIKLRKKTKVIQIGSTIQQNFGETITNHGYGVFDLESDNYTFVDLPNPKPFITFNMSSFEDLENGSEQLMNL